VGLWARRRVPQLRRGPANQDANLCAIDLLSVTGLVNYFGKSPTVDDVEVRPILLQKGVVQSVRS
jgi:hypothetical protein